MTSESSSYVAPAIASGVGQRRNSSGVTLFTWASVVCADSKTAMTSPERGLMVQKALDRPVSLVQTTARLDRAFALCRIRLTWHPPWLLSFKDAGT